MAKYDLSMVWQWHSDGVHTICIHNLQEIYNTVGVYKPGEPDKRRQPSQPEPSKLGKGKMYNNTRKHLKIPHSLQYISTNRQPNQPESSKVRKNIKYKTYVHYNTNKHTCPCAAGMSNLFRCPAAIDTRSASTGSWHGDLRLSVPAGNTFKHT